MTRYRCSGCLGEYDDVGADGVPYAHVCPPITEARVKRLGARIFVGLSDIRATDTITVLRNGARVETTVALMEAGDVRLDDRQTPRAAGVHRDERARPVAVGAGRASGTNRPITAEGAGRTPL